MSHEANADRDEPRAGEAHGFTLGVAVAGLRDEAHLGRSLDAADQALAEARIQPVARVLVAADGSAAAEKIAREKGWTFRRILPGSPRTRAAAREAARRAAGGSATLVIDGDVALEPGFLVPALAALAARDGVAGVGGRVDEAHWRTGALVGGRRDVDRVGGGGAAHRLRDAVLWRREALDAVGGYDLWVPAADDEELAGRLRMAGYALVALAATAGVRHGLARHSAGEFVARLRSGAMNGPGLVLRRSRGTMAFGEHLRRSTGRFLLLAWMLLGIALGLFGSRAGLGTMWAWATVGLLVFFAVLELSLPRAFWRGLTALAEALGIARNLVAPVALPRVGPAPKPIPPPAPAEPARPPGADEDERPLGDADDPPPLVRRG